MIGRTAGRESRVEPRARPVGAMALLLASLAVAACEAERRGPGPDPELQTELGLGADETVHRVVITGGPDGEHLGPPVQEVRPGDLVEFVTADGRIHLVTFDLEAMGAPQARFLRETGQDQSAPMIQEGSRFVVTFAGAPPGEYLFTAGGSADAVEGRIRVVARDEERPR